MISSAASLRRCLLDEARLYRRLVVTTHTSLTLLFLENVVNLPSFDNAVLARIH